MSTNKYLDKQAARSFGAPNLAHCRVARSESGIYLAFVAMFLMVIFAGLCAYVVGAGYLSIDKSHLSNIANVTALAAVEEFAESSELTFADKAIAARDRARFIASKNELMGTHSSTKLGDDLILGYAESDAPGAGGRLLLGRWITERLEASGSDPAEICPNDKYPCFLVSPQDSSGRKANINAAQVTVCNQSGSNPILAPFVEVPITQCATATSALTQRCVAFLVDVTKSTVADTHLSNRWAGYSVSIENVSGVPLPRVTKPRRDETVLWNKDNNPSKIGIPFYHAEVQNYLCDLASSFNPSENPYYVESLFWCSMGEDRPLNEVVDPKIHYKSDYQLRTAKGGISIRADVLSDDGYNGPQPFTDMFLAINVGLRTLAQKKSGGDRVMLMAFDSNIVERIPATGMTSDLDDMIRITNLDRRGLKNKTNNSTTAVQSPNFLEHDFFPLPGRGTDQTNIPLALDSAIAIMRTSCPANSKKSIMLFSDGISSCSRDFGSGETTYKSSANDVAEALVYDYTCGKISPPNIPSPTQVNSEYSHTLQSDAQITGAYAANLNDQQGRPSVLSKLLSAGISLTTVLAGNSVAPSERNQALPGAKVGFMTQDDAAELGYGRTHDSSNGVKLMFNGPVLFPYMWDMINWAKNVPPHPPGEPYPHPERFLPGCENADPAFCACTNIPRPGVYCGRPNRVYGPVSLDSGGKHCPLRPLCKPGPLDFNLTEEQKVENGLTWARCPYDQPSSRACPNGSCYETNPADPTGPKIQTKTSRDLAALYTGFNYNGTSGYTDTGVHTVKNPPLDSQHCGYPFYGLTQTCSPVEMTKGEQAAKCAVDVVGDNPYILVEGD